MEENTNTERVVKPPKFNVPYQIDYGEIMQYASKDGSELQREVITDTYVTASENEDFMMEQLNNAAEILRPKTRGVAGYLSFYYLMLTMFYILKKYDNCLSVLDMITKGIDAIDGYLMTGSFLDSNGNDSQFTNLTFGEDETEVKNTMKFAIDTYNTARLVHTKASSFESGYSLMVAAIILHAYHKQKGMIHEDADKLRSLVDHIREFIINERDNPPSENIEASADMNFGSIDELKID